MNDFQDLAYENELKARVRERVPGKVFDAHVHMSRCDARAHIKGLEAGARYWRGEMEDIFGSGRVAGGMFMPEIVPTTAVAEENDYVLTQTAIERGSVMGLLIPYASSREYAERMIAAHDDLQVLKPYAAYAVGERRDTQCGLEDFVPEWAWELADKYRLSVMVHLMRYITALNDPLNGPRVREKLLRYPNMRMILAHCASGHASETVRNGLNYVKDLDNVWFDTSGITEPAAFCHILDQVGPQRLLYGSDIPFGTGVGRFTELGKCFIGFGDSMVPQSWRDNNNKGYYSFSLMTYTLENLKSTLTAADEYRLSKRELSNIFYDNAAWLFGLDKNGERVGRAALETGYREQRRAESDTAGCELYSQRATVWTHDAVPFYDFSSDYLKNEPLGYNPFGAMARDVKGEDDGISAKTKLKALGISCDGMSEYDACIKLRKHSYMLENDAAKLLHNDLDAAEAILARYGTIERGERYVKLVSSYDGLYGFMKRRGFLFDGVYYSCVFHTAQARDRLDAALKDFFRK